MRARAIVSLLVALSPAITGCGSDDHDSTTPGGAAGSSPSGGSAGTGGNGAGAGQGGTSGQGGSGQGGAAGDPGGSGMSGRSGHGGAAPVGTPLTSFTLTSATGGLVPFAIGHAFRPGDVPTGVAAGLGLAHGEVIVKNRWPDGSVKLAVVAGQVEAQAGTPVEVTVTVAASAAPASPLTTADLAQTGTTAAIDGGTFGAVSWSGDDWKQPFQTWVSGPEMSSWVYRKPVGSDAHLVAWLEVRLFAGGVVEVLPWIENGYVKVAAPTSKSATYAFALDGKPRFAKAVTLGHHTRTPLLDGAALSYWSVPDPQLHVRHDPAYLMATGLVPTYRAAVAPDNGRVLAQPTTFAPLQQGSFTYSSDSMASPGYQEPIGLLPEHDVLYLVTTAPVAYESVVRNGYSAGRYALHYRDETTQRPIRFSAYPDLGLADGSAFKDNGASLQFTPTPTGDSPPGWDCAHSPSVGFMAYLVTGRWYFMEEVQFAATANHLGKGSVAALRDGAKGLVKPEIGAWQTRAAAWQWRTLVQALSATPDEDEPLRGELIASVEANIDYFHTKYVAQPNNPFGWVKPGEAYDDRLNLGSPWQQDFLTAGVGYARAMQLPISPAHADRLAAFFDWKAKSVVGRFGLSTQWWYVNAAPYTVQFSPVAVPNFDDGSGPWYASEAEMYAATYAQPPAWLGSTEGVLAGEILPGADAMWGNLQPALAYAVQFKVPGAKEGYERMTGAQNWPALRDQFNASRPVWSVKPATGP